MNEHCYYKVNIDISNALNPNWRMPLPTGNYGIWAPRARDIFSQDWLDYTASLGLHFGHALLFYRGPNTTSKEAHVDTAADSKSFIGFALNWVIGGRNSHMNWFKMPGLEAATAVKDTTSKVPYTTFQFKDLEYVESCSIFDDITLVRTDIPHSITMGNEKRWCISARMIKGFDMPWHSAVQYFRTKNLLVERT